MGRQFTSVIRTRWHSAGQKEVFGSKIVWEGEVEVFNVTGHPRAKRAYAWSQDQGTPQEKFTAALETPPVKSALDAVKMSMVAEFKKLGPHL